MSFVFYDTETTGISTAFDQILQFGAVHTDENLNVLERFEIRCRLQPHIIMSPGAMLVTGVTIEQASHPDHPSHYEMVRAIREKLVQWSPAIFVGYNSMAFDEELLRQAFYQTLHDPYLTNKQGNTRADAMLLVKGVAQFEPDCLVIPAKSNGRPNFKLDALAPANGFDHQNAHDAMADVEALIHLCKIIADEAPQEWSNFIRFSQKATCADFLGAGDPVLLSEYYSFGGQKHFPVICIGSDMEQPNKHLCFDLSHDPSDFRTLDHAALIQCIKNGPKPLRKTKINAAPSIRDIYDAPAWCLGGLSVDDIEARAQDVLADAEFIARLIAAYEASKEEYPESDHVEERIYGGFASPADSALMEQFHARPWDQRHGLIDQFQDGRFLLLAARLIYAHQPELLPDPRRQQIKDHIRERIFFEGECKWGTIPKALAECDAKLPSAAGSQAVMLYGYRSILSTFTI